MKKRDIILDFTSLLDVTLIIIFFFVLFSHLDSEANRTLTEEKVKELETATQQAEAREERAKELEDQLQEDINTVAVSNYRQSQNLDEIVKFGHGNNLKLVLHVDESAAWSMDVIVNSADSARISKGDNVYDKLSSLLGSAGYDTDDTVFCELIYDGSMAGSRSAYDTIDSGLNEIMRDYRYFYVSETDTATGGDEQ